MRMDDFTVKVTAKRLLCSTTWCAVWAHVTDDVRDALVDMALMDAVRSADDDSQVEVGQLLAFRARVVAALTEGVNVGKLRKRLRFDRDREARHEQAAYDRGFAAGVEAEAAAAEIKTTKAQTP